MIVNAEIEVVVRVPGTVLIDHQSYLDWLDGNPETDDALFDYIRTDPDWMEGSNFPPASSTDHDVIEVELVSVGGMTEKERGLVHGHKQTETCGRCLA